MRSFWKAPLVRIRVGRRVFAPRVLTTTLVLLLMPVLLGLGHWQLDRGTEKAQRQILLEARGKEQRSLSDLEIGFSRGDDIRFYAVALIGRFRNDRNILLDNQPHDGRPGYHVLTPFETGNALILIDRGWVPADPDRSRLPQIAPIDGKLTVKGRVAIPEIGFRVGDSVIESEGFPLRVLQLDLKELRQRLGNDLLPFIVELGKEEAHGYVRDWRIGGLTPERHFGYAIQWFSLAGLLSILYFVTNLRREE